MHEQDKDDILDTLNQYAQQFNAMVHSILTRKNGSEETAAMFDPEKLGTLLSGDAVEVDSAKLVQIQMDFMRQQTELWQQATKAMLGEKSQPVMEEERGDRRFSHSTIAGESAADGADLL